MPKPKAKPKAESQPEFQPKSAEFGMVLLDRNSKEYRVARASALRKLRMKNPKGAIIFTREEMDAITPPLKPGQESFYDFLVRIGMVDSIREVAELRAKEGLPSEFDALREERN